MRVAAVIVLLSALDVSGTGVAGAAAAQGACKGSLARAIPIRAPEALTGSELARRMVGMDDDQREATLLSQLLAGNVPKFLRHLIPVTLSRTLPDGHRTQVTVCVSPDYLAVGSDRNFLFTPLRLPSALEFARPYGFVLPTPKIVDAIYAQARAQLRPQPLPPGDEMRSPEYYWRHNELIRTQRLAFDAPLDALVAGDKKDLVITNLLWKMPSRVAIYGWHRDTGKPIQPLSIVHGIRYADYSHGVRLVSATAYLNGQPRSLLSLLQDPQLAPLVSGEGAIRGVSRLMASRSGPLVAGLTRVSCSSGSPGDSWRDCARP